MYINVDVGESERGFRVCLDGRLAAYLAGWLAAAEQRHGSELRARFVRTQATT